MEKEHSFILEALSDFLKRCGLNNVFFSLPLKGNADYPIHPMPRLILCLSGEWAQQTHNCKRDLHQGDAVFALPGSFNFFVHKEAPGNIISIIFFPEYIRFVYAEKDFSGLVKQNFYYHTINGGICLSGYYLIQTLINLAKAEILDNAAVCRMSEYLAFIAMDKLKNDSASLLDGKAAATYKAICNYLYNHFQESLTRESAALELKITPTHISRLFNMFGNENFNAKLKRMRLQYAKGLLENTHLNISEIALQSGFSSECYFIQVFKAAYGISPGFFRNNERMHKFPQNEAKDKSI